MITMSGTTTAMNIQRASVAGEQLYWTVYQNIPTAFYGTDINQNIGTTTVTIIFKDGSRASGTFVITPRTRPQEEVIIPDSLGGNGAASGIQLESALEKDNADLAATYSRTDKALWTGAFAFPVASTSINPRFVTSPYGYNRMSGAETIVHKGTDFRAATGTPVYAINRGIVRKAKVYAIYGDTVIIDHGLGLLSMYMHLSKMSVNPGQLVRKGDLLGYSGNTGYAEGPHLHLTIRIGGVSIDPMKFFALFGVK